MDTPPTFEITALNGVTFRAEIIKPGGHYGAQGSLVNDGQENIVQFYDMRHGENSENGQFVTFYSQSTLLDDHEPGIGLKLDTCADDWVIDGKSYQAVIDWLRAQ